MNVILRWITPEAERQIVDIARVSSDPAKAKQPDEKLIAYLIRNRHWSPFEMASACFEISDVSRAITRQILRHRSLHVQEFSQRYQDAQIAGGAMLTEVRMQHPTNRQASLDTADDGLRTWWREAQWDAATTAHDIYRQALAKGIAKEVARIVLPEGMTPTRMMASGTIRDWLHYCGVRRGNGTQPEHVEVADAIWSILRRELPTITAAWEAAA